MAVLLIIMPRSNMKVKVAVLLIIMPRSLTCSLSLMFDLLFTWILTWILGVASKQLRLLHGQVRDSTTVVNSLSPQMSELVKDAIAP